MYDKYSNSAIGDLVIPVGELKIIHVQGDVSVGRTYKVYEDEETPLLEYSNIRVGDRLNLNKVRPAPSGRLKGSKTSASENPGKSRNVEKKGSVLDKSKKSKKSLLKAKVQPPEVKRAREVAKVPQKPKTSQKPKSSSSTKPVESSLH